MTPGDFQKLWKTLQNRPELMRPWPLESVALEIQKDLQDPPRGGEVTVAKMSRFKAAAAIGKRDSYPDQKAVMTASATAVRYPFYIWIFGTDSITQLAKKMWGNNAVSDGSPADAEVCFTLFLRMFCQSMGLVIVAPP
jgi:hypothetical protein